MKIHIGKRIWKTAIAVFVCFLIYMLRSEQSFPFFSTITAILCMQPYVGNIRKIAANQLLGTLVGALYGSAVLFLFWYAFPQAETIIIITVVSLFIVLVIETAVLMGKADLANFMCVVFLCMAIYLFQEGDPMFYVFDRVLDTLIGVVVAFVINSLDIPRRRRKELLFVSAFDSLMRENHRLSPFSTTELNRMIADGAAFTVTTEQTPASLMEFLGELKFNLPVIAMNGAVLYDTDSNKYIHKVPLKREIVEEIIKILDREDAGCFYDSLIQDTLLIYFEDFKSMAMQEMYRDLRRNPYRNYIWGKLPDNAMILYLYIIDDEEKIRKIIKEIEKSPIAGEVRMLTGREEKYSGHCYLKILDKEATRQNMIEYLRQIIDAEAAVVFGNKEGKCDFLIMDGNEDRAVKLMKALYRPYLWQKDYRAEIAGIKKRLKI